MATTNCQQSDTQTPCVETGHAATVRSSRRSRLLRPRAHAGRRWAGLLLTACAVLVLTGTPHTVTASSNTTTIYSPAHPDFGRQDYKCDIPNRVVETTDRAIRSKVFQISCGAVPGAILHGAVVEIFAHDQYTSTATEGSSGDWDYNFYHSKIKIYPGDRGIQRLGILINDDQTGEGSETIWFKLKWTTKLGYPPAWIDLMYSITDVRIHIDDDDEFNLTVSPGQAWEEDGAKTVTVTAATASGAKLDAARTLSVQVGAATDTATEGTDYQTVNNFDVTIPKGSSSGSGTFTLTPIDDSLMESGERITVAGSASTSINGRTLTARVNGTNVLMTDNETINLSASPAQVGEGAGATQVTVTASVAGGGTVSVATPVTVKVGLSGQNGDTAVSGTDYATVPNFTVTIPAGQSSGTGTFTLTPTDDSTIEATETITVGGVKSQALKYRVGWTTMQLLDNDADTVSLTAVPATMSEDASPTTVTVRATAATSLPMARTVTVAVGKSGDSATEGTDYATVADFTITIPANDTTAGVDITLTPTDDTLVESDETISVSGSGTNMTVTGASITLTDNDAAIALSANPPAVVEGGGEKTITVTATGVGTAATARTVAVKVGKKGDSATEGTDYATVADFNMTIPANAKSGTGTFKLTPTDDATVEGDEWITVSGTSTGATVTGTGVNLIDNDARIALSANPSSVLEISDQVTQVTVTATLNSTLSSARTVPVQVGKTGDSATEGTDYATVADFSITIPANAASGTGTFVLQTKGDEVFEGTETISVYGNIPNATVVGTTVSIVENPETNPFILTASPATVSEGAGATQVTVTAKLGGTATVKTATPVKVQIGQAADTATEGTDYATVADFTVTIAAGQSSGTGTFTLTPTDDSVAEISEGIAVIGSVKDHTNVSRNQPDAHRQRRGGHPVGVARQRERERRRYHRHRDRHVDERPLVHGYVGDNPGGQDRRQRGRNYRLRRSRRLHHLHPVGRKVGDRHVHPDARERQVVRGGIRVVDDRRQRHQCDRQRNVRRDPRQQRQRPDEGVPQPQPQARQGVQRRHRGDGDRQAAGRRLVSREAGNHDLRGRKRRLRHLGHRLQGGQGLHPGHPGGARQRPRHLRPGADRRHHERRRRADHGVGIRDAPRRGQ